MQTCPCGIQKEFEACCGIYHESLDAPTPEALMRSRYSAFAKQKIDYLEKTTDPQTKTQFDFKANSEWARQATFTGLEILSSSQEGTKGFVEFKARYDLNGQPHTHHEKSRFRKQEGRWYYREGKVFETEP